MHVSPATMKFLRCLRAKAIRLSAEGERQLIIKAQAGDAAARELLIRAYVPLLMKNVKKFTGYQRAEYEDFLSQAILGLLQAIERFDPQYQNRLVTLADPWTRALLAEHAMDSSSPLKVITTPWAKKCFFRLRREKARLGVLGNMTPDQCATVAARLGMRPDQVAEMEKRLQPVASLNAKIKMHDHDVEEGEEWLDRLPDTNAIAADELVIEKQERERNQAFLEERLAVLDERERSIVVARRLEGATLSTLSAKWKVSSERIRQIEATAIVKLKSPLSPERAAKEARGRENNRASTTAEQLEERERLAAEREHKREERKAQVAQRYHQRSVKRKAALAASRDTILAAIVKIGNEKPLGEIARRLNAMGLRTIVRSRPWSAESLKYFLRQLEAPEARAAA